MFSLAADRCNDGREHRCVGEARLPAVPAGLGEEPSGHLPREWACALDGFASGAYRAAALRTLEALVDEGAAFHNCLGTLASTCQSGRQQYFAVRCLRTGARVAVACIAWLDERQAWALVDIKGPANTEAPFPVLEFGMILAAAYARSSAYPPTPSSACSNSAAKPSTTAAA